MTKWWNHCWPCSLLTRCNPRTPSRPKLSTPRRFRRFSTPSPTQRVNFWKNLLKRREKMFYFHRCFPFAHDESLPGRWHLQTWRHPLPEGPSVWKRRPRLTLGLPRGAGSVGLGQRWEHFRFIPFPLSTMTNWWKHFTFFFIWLTNGSKNLII